jgi:hypothetical protein
LSGKRKYEMGGGGGGDDRVKSDKKGVRSGFGGIFNA